MGKNHFNNKKVCQGAQTRTFTCTCGFQIIGSNRDIGFKLKLHLKICNKN